MLRNVTFLKAHRVAPGAEMSMASLTPHPLAKGHFAFDRWGSLPVAVALVPIHDLRGLGGSYDVLRGITMQMPSHIRWPTPTGGRFFIETIPRLPESR